METENFAYKFIASFWITFIFVFIIIAIVFHDPYQYVYAIALTPSGFTYYKLWKQSLIAEINNRNMGRY